MEKIAKVIVDITNSEVDRTFDYLLSDELGIVAGDRVLVPFGNRQIEGVVLEISTCSDYDLSKLKFVSKKLDDFVAITKNNLELAKQTSQKFYLRLADILRLLIPTGLRGGKTKDKIKEYLHIDKDAKIENISKNARKQILLFNFLKENEKIEKAEAAKTFGQSAVKGLLDLKIATIESVKTSRLPLSETITKEKVIKFTPEQTRAINSVELSTNKTYLLHGVTGSGKTEVYMALIEKALATGKSAIMLVPEISLTPQVVSHFKARFGDNIALLHSGLSAGEKMDEWKRLRLGQAKVAVGPRSAIFAPLENVGIIIIDEEHDQSYISESNPRYDTHDVAEMRSKLENCPLILGSATPSVSTYIKTESGEMTLLELPTRANGRPLPKVQIVDMLGEVKKSGELIFSQTLLDELSLVEKNKKQAMLLMNRRGYSSFFQCKECGYVAKCESCDVSLVYHKEDETLRCHYCGKKYKALTSCPDCHSSYIKQGAVGTEKIVCELQKIFPNVKILRMDNDTTSQKNAHQKILKEFSQTKPCFLVGTQMIAKGHDFEDVTLVGILDGDQPLFHSNYLSTERTFQLLTQMSGRAGRSLTPGLVILQTFAPRHYVFKFVANANYKDFYKKEKNVRETTLFPPFSNILKIVIASPKEEIARETAKQLFSQIQKYQIENRDKFYCLTASACPISKLQNTYRFQIVMRTKKDENICKNIFSIANGVKHKNCSIFAQINPQSLS